MDFFDVNVTLGRPQAEPLFTPVVDGPAVRQHLDAKGIGRAVVCHWAQADASPLAGNACVDEAVAATPGLAGCWALLPPLTDPLITADFFPRMAAAGAVVVAMLPKAHRYLLDPLVWGRFLGELCERRIPVMLTMGEQVEWADLYRFLQAVPTLTCILRNIGTWSMDRYTYPLLDAYAGVCVETSMLSLEDGGVEAMVSRFGASRLLFGSGFPVRYAESAMLQLTHAEIAEAEKWAIAAGNLEGLIAGADYA